MDGEGDILTTTGRPAGSGATNRPADRLSARLGAYRRLAAAAGLVLGCLMLSPAPAPAQSVSDGIAAFRQGDFQTARDIWQPLAGAGDPVAQFNLGKLYEYGGGSVRQDYTEAARWYREAADQGIAEAQNNLGLMYAQGLGVPRDARHAAELWKQAADNNYSLAQYNLALAVFRGEGVTRDERVAVIWFERAARAGLPDAQYAMGQLMRLGRAGPRDEGQALTWYQLAAAQGHAEAASQAAALEGRGVVAKAPVPIAPAPAAAAASPAPPDAPQAPEPSDAADEPGGELAAAPDATGGTAAAETMTGETAGAAAVPVPEPKPEPPAATGDQQTAALPADAPVTDAPATTETQAAPEEPGSAAGGDQAVPPKTEYRLWLVSADSEVAAEDLREETLARHGEALSGVTLDIYQVDYGERGHFFRVLAGPLYSADAANDLCRRLREDDPEEFCKVLTR